MESKLLLVEPQPNAVYYCCLKATSVGQRQRQSMMSKTETTRRKVLMAASALAAVVLNCEGKFAKGLDLRMVAPDQTVEEAESGIRGHALALLQVKALIDSQSWGEAQKALRKSSAYLRQDFYTIIQAKPPTHRPQLRKLYFDLFNNVTKLDYAARDKDASRVFKCYDNIVMALNDILSRI